MRVTFDPGADAAYIYLREIEPGGAKSTVPVDTGEISAGEILLDFDAEGRLIGIEILDAKRGLPGSLLEEAEGSH